MKVAVTGATGLIGRHLITGLRRRGDSVVALSRRSGWVGGVQLTRWDPLAGPPPIAGEVDAIVNLAGESIGSHRWSEARKQAIRNSRILVTRRCVEACPEGGTLISGSGVGYYAETEDAIDEDAPRGAGFLASLCAVWEAEARQAEHRRARVVLLRFGSIVLARDGGALPRLVRATRLGAGGALGGGRQWWSWIHIQDTVGLILHALDQPAVRGPMNVTAPAPARQVEVARALAAALRRPIVVATPGLAVRVLMGEAAEIVLAGHRAFPALAIGTGYEFAFPSLVGAMADLFGTRV